MELGKKYKVTLVDRYFFGIYRGQSNGFFVFYDDFKDMEISVRQDAPVLIEDYRGGGP